MGSVWLCLGLGSFSSLANSILACFGVFGCQLRLFGYVCPWVGRFVDPSLRPKSARRSCSRRPARQLNSSDIFCLWRSGIHHQGTEAAHGLCKARLILPVGLKAFYSSTAQLLALEEHDSFPPKSYFPVTRFLETAFLHGRCSCVHPVSIGQVLRGSLS